MSLPVSIDLSLFKDGRIIKCLITEKRHQNIMVNCSITCYYSWAMYSTNGPFYARFRDHPGNKVFVSRKRLLVKTWHAVINSNAIIYRLLCLCNIRLNSYRYIYVVVNLLSQVIFIFLLFKLHSHTLPYSKTNKRKQKLSGIKI